MRQLQPGRMKAATRIDDENIILLRGKFDYLQPMRQLRDFVFAVAAAVTLALAVYLTFTVARWANRGTEARDGELNLMSARLAKFALGIFLLLALTRGSLGAESGAESGLAAASPSPSRGT